MEIARNCTQVDVKELVKVDTVVGSVFIKRFVKCPSGHITIEDFAAGSTFVWTFWHAEVHYIVSGKAEVTFSLPPLHQREKTVTINAGDAYLVHRGERVTFKVDPAGPYRHLCILMPAVPLHTGDHLIAEHYESFKAP